MSAPSQAPAESSRSSSAQAGAGLAPDREQLRKDYKALGNQMRYWLLSGAALLLALLLLWRLLPTGRRLVPTPTMGYRWRQAGTVQQGDTTWVWALADSAGRARLLLSRTQGRTWVVRDLGVPAAQARALALGWGRPWRGVLLGQKGALRLLPDVWRTPGQGTALGSPTTKVTTLLVNALTSDTRGKILVVADSVGGHIWQSLNAGQNWEQWAPHDYFGNTLVYFDMQPVAQLVFEPTQQRFLAVSAQQIWWQDRPSARSWTLLPPHGGNASGVLYTKLVDKESLLVIYKDGSAFRVAIGGSSTITKATAGFQAFTNLPQPLLALAGWQRQALAMGDSALFFQELSGTGIIRRARLETAAENAQSAAYRHRLAADSLARAELVRRAQAAATDTAMPRAAPAADTTTTL